MIRSDLIIKYVCTAYIEWMDVKIASVEVTKLEHETTADCSKSSLEMIRVLTLFST